MDQPMTFDERLLESSIEQSRDAQTDATRQHRETLPDFAEVRDARRHDEIDPDSVARFDEHRRGLAAGLGRRGLLAGGLGAALAALLTAPAAADTNLDIQILQTASSLEILMVSTYATALTRPFFSGSNPLLIRFAQQTMNQHDEHRRAFQARTKALGGKIQRRPNPNYSAQVDRASPALTAPVQVTKLAAILEQVATDTYLSDLTLLADGPAKTLMASVMGVEAQHLATMRTATALFDAGKRDLISVPVDAAALPAVVVTAAFPGALEGTTMASPPSEGAVL
jgi:hypothetical protein